MSDRRVPNYYEDDGERPDAARWQHAAAVGDGTPQVLTVYDARDSKVNSALDKLLLEFVGRPDLNQMYNMFWNAQGSTRQDFKFDGVASEWGQAANTLGIRESETRSI